MRLVLFLELCLRKENVQMKITIIPNQIKAVANCIPEIYTFLQQMRESFLDENPLLEEIIITAEFCGYDPEPQFLLRANALIIHIGVGVEVNATEICERIGCCLLKAA